jgi:hypothetical protein
VINIWVTVSELDWYEKELQNLVLSINYYGISIS